MLQISWVSVSADLRARVQCSFPVCGLSYLQDSLVEMAAGGSKRFEGILYLLFFIVAALLVFLHTCFCDRSFSMQLHRFICY